MSGHTPGRLAYQENSDAYTHILRDASNRIVHQGSQDSSGQSEADARRLAACWNACEGLPTERLESEQLANTMSCDTVEVCELRHKLDQANVERTTLQRRIATHRDEFGRLHARIGTLQDQAMKRAEGDDVVSAGYMKLQNDLAAARALLSGVLALADTDNVATLDGDGEPTSTGYFDAVAGSIRALLKGGAQ